MHQQNSNDANTPSTSIPAPQPLTTYSTGSSCSHPLIAPKHFRSFGPEEFQEYVKGMYAERKTAKRGPKAIKLKQPELAAGVSIRRSPKTGAVGITRNKRKRAFPYVLRSEVSALAAAHSISVAELWNTFLRKEWLICDTKEQAEATAQSIKELPW